MSLGIAESTAFLYQNLHVTLFDGSVSDIHGIISYGRDIHEAAKSEG